MPVEIGLKFGDYGIASLLIDNSKFLNLINDAKVCGNIHALVMGRCPRVAVNLAGKFFQMHTKHSKTNEFKVGWVKFDVPFEQL